MGRIRPQERQWVTLQGWWAGKEHADWQLLAAAAIEADCPECSPDRFRRVLRSALGGDSSRVENQDPLRKTRRCLLPVEEHKQSMSRPYVVMKTLMMPLQKELFPVLMNAKNRSIKATDECTPHHEHSADGISRRGLSVRADGWGGSWGPFGALWFKLLFVLA